MEKNSCQAILAFLLLVLLSACQEEQIAEPRFTAEMTREAVTGKWKIDLIDYRLCRSGQCQNSRYKGMAQDYFEFKADSAFLFRYGVATGVQVERFKVYYNMPGAFLLSNGSWTGKFEVKECRQRELILMNTFTGTDPYAAFTDTYYLYK